MICNKEEMKEDIKINVNNTNTETHDEPIIWRSCCLHLDREFTLFITKYMMIVGLLTFFGYNLSQVKECSDKNLWQSLLLLVIGIALPSPTLTQKK